MRNAAAHIDDDLAFDEPARKPKAVRKTRGAGAAKRFSAKPRKAKRRYAHFIAIGLSASLAVGIMVNALVLQHDRHPAPLFGEAIQLGAQPTKTAAVAAPTLSTAPSQTPASKPIDQTGGLPPAAAPAQPVAVPHSRHPAKEIPAPTSKAQQDDPIARLLKTSAAPVGGEKAKEKDSPKAVLATQHALMKLGFVVKPTGTFGPVTRSAIEAFERDQHLPVRGEMSRALLKQLSAESGIAID